MSVKTTFMTKEVFLVVQTQLVHFTHNSQGAWRIKGLETSFHEF